MPAGLQQFARYQPFTPVTETLRGLLTGTPIGTDAIVAIAWSVGIAAVSTSGRSTSTDTGSRRSQGVAAD